MQTPVHHNDIHIHHFSSSAELYASITKEGSIGLLALGYDGLLRWRASRAILSDEFPRTTEEEMVKKMSA